MATATVTPPVPLGFGVPSSFQTDPTLAGFVSFIRQYMGIPSTVLPDDSQYIADAFWFAMTVCNQYLAIVGNADPSGATNTYYAWAVYNLAGDCLVRLAQDDPTLPPPNNTYFADLRKTLGVNSFQPGIVQSTSDNGSSVSFMIPDWYKNISLADQMLLGTPWGRAYLALAQAYGPTIWGLNP
jgi:hypothetical protein